ncbi:MAG: hypothetical protein C0594_16885 [Marinilabiliales bacterium]|nr:MAG: hypothetical protein C0594_16885 [Marinilabiliales bacterium]
MRILSVLFVSVASAQKGKPKRAQKEPTWVYLEAGGGYGNSMWLNDAFSTSSNYKMSYANPAYGFGAKVGVDFRFGVGLAFEFGSTTLAQKYDSKNTSWTETIQLSTLDKTFLLRGISDGGTYIEVGPQFSSISTNSSSNSQKYNDNLTNIVFGFGGPMIYHQNFDINFGLRFGYCASELVNNDLPFDIGLGDSVYYILAPDPIEPTHPFYAQIRVNVNWHIGYFQTAKCDGHSAFLMF